MTRAGALAILPYFVLAAFAVAVMLTIAVRRNHALAAGGSIAGLILAFIALPFAAESAPRQVTPLFRIDGYSLFYLGVILFSAIVVAVLSYGYFETREDGPPEEYYLLLLLATLGAGAVVASSHFAGFFLGLETLSVSLFGLIAYRCNSERSVEAGVKYLILSGTASAFLLFGIALVYAELGKLTFAAGTAAAQAARLHEIVWLAGLAMVLTGVGFKLSVVPFHMWAPDIYEGAPAPVTAFVAVVSKIAVFALLLRYFVIAQVPRTSSLMLTLAVVAVLSMIVGNLLALLQDNVKRILAYSSIAHLGYVLVAFLAAGSVAIEAVSMYLVAYAVTTLGAFGVVTMLSPPGAARDADAVADYRGLFWVHPVLAGIFTTMLLSLAGIPLTLGFIAKFYAIAAGVDASLAIPVAALVLGSAIGLYYYLRIVVTMVLPLPAETGATPRSASGWAANAAMAAILVILVGFGIYPGPLIGAIRGSAVGGAAVSASVVGRAAFLASAHLSGRSSASTR